MKQLERDMGSSAGILRWATGLGLMACALLSAPALAAAPCAESPWLGCGSLRLIGESLGPGHFNPGLRYTLPQWWDESRFVRVHLDTHVDTRPPLRRWRYGVGLDVALPWEGMLEASAYTSRRRGKRAPRFDLQDERWGGAEGARRWTIGAYVAPIKPEGGRRELTVAPQLRVDLDALRLLPGNAELSVEYVPWERSGRADADERVWQLSLHWSL